MAERMTLEELNRLLAVALERRHRAGGLITPQVNPHRPWLPLSYWDEQRVQEVKQDILDLAEHMKVRKVERFFEDKQLADRSVDDVMAEWDDELPTLQGPSAALREAGWGRDTMKSSAWRATTKTPAPPDQMQPVYNFECYQCGRPITEDDTYGNVWKDHGGKMACDAALMPHDYEPWGNHTPKPWHGEEEDDDYDDDDD